jgi:hypothetical protein
MKFVFAVLFLIALTAVIPGDAYAQDWPKIIPVKTARPEVEQLLGPSNGAYFGEYDLKDGILFVEYSSGPCRPDRKGGWNVVKNIVVSMSFTPKHPKRVSELKLDRRKFRRLIDNHLPSVTYYINDDEGITYAIQQGKVDYVEYGPAKKYEYLHCRISTEPFDMRRVVGGEVLRSKCLQESGKDLGLNTRPSQV